MKLFFLHACAFSLVLLSTTQARKVSLLQDHISSCRHWLGTDYSLSYWEINHNEHGEPSIVIKAMDSCGAPRQCGGDLFVAHAYSRQGHFSSKVIDNLDGAYRIIFDLPPFPLIAPLPNKFKVKVLLGIKDVSNLNCSQSKQTLQPAFVNRFRQLSKLKKCVWQYVNSKDLQEYVILPVKNQTNSYTRLKAENKFSLNGMWRRIDLCSECPFCQSSKNKMAAFNWKDPYVYCTFNFNPHWFMGEKDLEKCAYGKSIVLAGDSVTKGGFSKSAHKYGIPVQTLDLYSIFDTGNFVKQLKKIWITTLIVGTGRHDIIKYSVFEYMNRIKDHIIPLLAKLNRRGVKIIWVLTSAPRYREPLGTRVRQEQKLHILKLPRKIRRKIVSQQSTCIPQQFVRKYSRSKSKDIKEQCLAGRDACDKYSQRWDRIVELNNQLTTELRKTQWIEIFDSFKITDTGIWEWFDDNIHHHFEASGVGDIVFQYILNMVCNP